MLGNESDPKEQVLKAWNLKKQIRETAANAMYSPALKKKFFDRLPLPDLDSFASMPSAEALRKLMMASQSGRTAFPGTFGESIGLEYHDGRQTWVMTEGGWVAKA